MDNRKDFLAKIAEASVDAIEITKMLCKYEDMHIVLPMMGTCIDEWAEAKGCDPEDIAIGLLSLAATYKELNGVGIKVEKGWSS